MHLDLKNATVDGKILHELILVGVDVETLQFNTGHWYQPLKVIFCEIVNLYVCFFGLWIFQFFHPNLEKSGDELAAEGS